MKRRMAALLVAALIVLLGAYVVLHMLGSQATRSLTGVEAPIDPQLSECPTSTVWADEKQHVYYPKSDVRFGRGVGELMCRSDALARGYLAATTRKDAAPASKISSQ